MLFFFFGKYFWTLPDHHLGSEGIVISVLECSHVGLYWGQTEGWREQERGLWIHFLIPVYDLGNLTFLVWACSVSCKVREWFLKSPLVLLRPMNLSFFIECTYVWDAVIVHRMFNGRQFTCQCRRCGFSSSARKIPWRRKWQLSPVFLLGKSHGQQAGGLRSVGSQSRTQLSD